MKAVQLRLNILVLKKAPGKLLEVKFDSYLSFENHVTSLCKKASQKLHALTRISRYTDLNKSRNLMKAFVTFQFSYFPLIWMFHSCNLNNKINWIHERAFILVYQNNLSSSEFLDLDNSVTTKKICKFIIQNLQS